MGRLQQQTCEEGKCVKLCTFLCSFLSSTLLLFPCLQLVYFFLRHNFIFLSHFRIIHYYNPPSSTDKTVLTFKIFCLSHYCFIVCLLYRHCMKTVLWQNFTQKCKSLSNIVCFHLSLLCELCTIPQLPYQKWVGIDEIFDFC